MYALYMSTLGNRPDLFPSSGYIGKYITNRPPEHEVPESYLNYCKKHGITRNYLVKKEEYDGIDAMKFYDKSAVAKFEKNRKTQDLCR